MEKKNSKNNILKFKNTFLESNIKILRTTMTGERQTGEGSKDFFLQFRKSDIFFDNPFKSFTIIVSILFRNHKTISSYFHIIFKYLQRITMSLIIMYQLKFHLQSMEEFSAIEFTSQVTTKRDLLSSKIRDKKIVLNELT